MDGRASSYIRVDAGQAMPAVQVVDANGALLFIDVAGHRAGGWEGEVADQLRFVEESALTGRSVLVLRGPAPADPDGLELIRDLILQRTGTVPTVAEASFPIGGPPSLRWSDGIERDDGSVLASARAVELAAILQSGAAHWRPPSFHYELPSGQHRSDFIRVGDGFRSPRDARVLASWCHRYVDVGRALLLDSSTLLPLAMALEDAANNAGMPLGPVVVRDSYPDSLLSDEELVELTVGANGALLLVSVSSTGSTQSALAKAVKAKGVRRWWVETLVDRRWPAATGLSTTETPSVVSEPWLHIAETDPQGGRGARHCLLCRDPKRSPVVRIDPGSFANTMLPEPPVVVMPDPPLLSRSLDRLLELYSDVDGIGLDCDPAARTRVRRTDGRWGVRFHPHRLLGHPDIVDAISSQLTADPGDINDGRCDLPKLRGFDTAVVISEDIADGDGSLEPVIAWLHDAYGEAGPLRTVAVPSAPTPGHQEDLAADLHHAKHILVVTVGTVTGGTLHELLIRINNALAPRAKGSYKVSGFVIHARPPSYREWQSVRSAYSQRLVAAWMTYLPAGDHPLGDEQRLFRQTLDDDLLSEAGRSFVRARRQWVLNNPQSEWPARRATWHPSSGSPNPASALLCGSPERPDEDLPRLQPNSRFGHRMSMIGTIAGVGATMHRARLERDRHGGPPGIRFDLTRIPAVYFEVPILAAVLRWLRPFEAFWEREDRSAEDSLREVWHQASFEQPGSRSLLLAELFLAAAAGKVPRHTYPLLRVFLEELEGSDEDYDPAPVEVTRQLLEAAWGAWPDEAKAPDEDA